MAVRRVQFRRGTHAQNDAFTGAVGEITIDTTNDSIRVHDGAFAGGRETLRADMTNLGSNVLAENGTVDYTDLAGNATVRLVNVADPTNNQDVATKAYVDSAGASEILLGELGNVTTAGLAQGQILVYNTTANPDVFKNVTMSGDISIDEDGVTAIAAGVIVNADIDDATIQNAKLANSSIATADSAANAGAVSLGGTLTFTQVANETTVVVNGAGVTIGLPDDVTIGQDLTVTRDLGVTQDLDVTRDITAGRNVVITGNLTVNGTTTTIDSTTVSTADVVIELASGADGAANASTDAGFVFTRGSNEHPAVFYWDEGVDAFLLGTGNGATGATTDFSTLNGNAGIDEGTLKLATLTASSSAEVQGNLTLKADNASFAIQTAGAVNKFTVDSDNGNTVISGTAEISGTADITGITTLDENLSIKSAATTSSILINSNLTGNGAEADANILHVVRGQLTGATLTWDEDDNDFIFSEKLHSVKQFSVGGAGSANATATISAAGAIGGVSISLSGAAAVSGATTLSSDATIETDASLLIQAANAETDRLIVLNNDVDGGGGSPAAQDAYIAVRRGAASFATVHWDEDDTTWTFTNSGSFATDLSVGQNLTVGQTATANLLRLKGDGQNAIILNSDLGGGVAPTADVGITVERGSATDAKLYFDEVTDNTWKIDRGDGNGGKTILLSGDSIPNTSLANSSITVARVGGNSDTVSLGDTLTFANVASETTIAVAADAGDGATVTVGLPDAVTLGTSLTIGTLTISDGSIDDTDGSISLGSTNLTAVGTIASGNITVGNTTIASGSITDTGGTVSFGDDIIATTGNIKTTAALLVRNAGDTQSALSIVANGDDATITSHGGDISFSDENLTTTGKVTTGTFESTGAADFGGNLTITADNALFTIETAGGADKFVVDTDNGNTTIAGTLDVTGESTFTAEAQLDGGIDVNASKFTVTSANGNTLTEGTLTVNGATTLAADVLIYDDTTDPNFTIQSVAGPATTFSVAGASGDTTIAGTLGVTGVSTFTANVVPLNDGGANLGTNGVRWGHVFTDALTMTDNASIGGTLGVTSTSTFTGLATFNGGIAGENGFSVSDGDGNVETNGTLSVGGQATFEAGISSINGNGGSETFAVAANGNTTVAGTLALAKTATINAADGSADLIIQNNAATKFSVDGGTGNTDIEGTLNVGSTTVIESGNLTVSTGDIIATQGDLTLTAGGVTATAAASSFQAVSATSFSQSGATLTLVSGGGAGTDAFIKVERGANDANIKWNETSDKWQVDSGDGNFYSILDSNTTLFRLTANGSNKDFSLQGTDTFETLTLVEGGGVSISHAGNGSVTIGLNDSQTFGTLTVTGQTTLTNATLKVADPLLILGNGNESKTVHTGFYTQYDDTDDTNTFAGLVFQPDENSRTGGGDTSTKRFKLFSTVTGLNSTEVVIAPTDSQLADLDLKTVRVTGDLKAEGGELSVPSSGGTDTLDANEYIYLATDNSTITLPAPVSGRKYLIKLAATHAQGVTINTNNTGAVKIDGDGTQTLGSSYAFIEIVSDGANWFIIGKDGTVTGSN